MESKKIKKRNGNLVDFDINKITAAIGKANNEVGDEDKMPQNFIDAVAREAAVKVFKQSDTPDVEEIQDTVIGTLIERGFVDVGIKYTLYREKRGLVRQANTTDKDILTLLDLKNKEAAVENSNKNPVRLSTQRDYMSGMTSRDIVERLLFPEDIIKAHKEGLIHVHDTDYISARIHNCDLVNLDDMLQNGTKITGAPIYKPHSFRTACTITTQIVSQVASSQFGGQTISLSHIAPFIDVSRQAIIKKLKEELVIAGVGNISEEAFNTIVKERLQDEIRAGVQTIQYQLITLMTTNGQAPFVSVFMYINEVPDGQTKEDLILLIKEVLKQRIEGIKDENGNRVTPAFPKLLYVLDEDNIRKDSKYWDVTKLAILCTTKRMNPDYISAKKMKELKNRDVYPCMGCRSFLTVDRTTENLANAGNYKLGEHKYYGRFNQGVVTINLVDVACSSKKDEDSFWKIFDERLDLCHRALQIRHKRLLGTVSDVAPILWQDGALARLKKGEVIDKLLYDGYSTISLGYAGLYECVYYMTGASHTGNGKDFAIKIMEHMNDKCNEWKAAENIDYSVYGTPLELTTYKFASCLKKRFGIIPEVTEYNYVTNSYHVNVRERIDAFTKLKFESTFQELSPGGAISYVEMANLMQNLEAVEALVTYIYDNIMYAELNTKIDICEKCGFEGEMKLTGEAGHRDWICPNCRNTDHNTLKITRRTCGYLGQNFWNAGRTDEINDRVLHL